MSSPDTTRRRQNKEEPPNEDASPGRSMLSKSDPGGSSEGAPEISIKIPWKSASLSVAHEYKTSVSCSSFDPSSNQFMPRPIFKTTREEIGEYGIGIQLYFELIVRVGVVLLIMGVLCLPLIALDFMGDFGGVRASFFAKLTIGNIGICGTYGELCRNVDSYPYRLLLSWSSAILRDVTPVLGALSTAGIGIFAAFIFYFYYIYLRKVKRAHKSHKLSLTDYAVEVDYLTPKLEPEELHATYEGLLATHFDKVAGKSGAVVEVALARDYHGGIRTFLEIHDLEIEIKEAREHIKRCSNAKKETKWSRRLEKLQKNQAMKEKAVMTQGYAHEYDRPVCRAFIIFSDNYYQERVLEAYKWSTKGYILRSWQSGPLKFNGRPIRVRRTNEPGNIYHENLDVSRIESRLRNFSTVVAAILILVIAAASLLLFQSATRANVPAGVGPRAVWVIANATAATDMCLETCGVGLFSDLACSESVESKISGFLQESGSFSASSPSFVLNNSSPGQNTCSNVWRSDRCVNVMAKNPTIWNIENTTSILLPTTSIFLTPSIHQFSSSSLPPPPLPASSPVCPSGSTLCSLSSLNICFTSAQKCDGIWHCPNGEDEAFCNYSCAPFSMACPLDGVCVDSMTGNCGSQCLAAEAATSPICSAISSRISQTLQPCERNTLTDLVASTFNGICLGGFFESPCCTVSELSSDQREFLSSCSANSAVNDAEKSPAGLSMLGYMTAYCSRGEMRAEPSLNRICSEADVWETVSFSPNCHAAMTGNKRWCECLNETSILVARETLDRLERCQIPSDKYSFFGSRNGFNRLGSFMDVLRTACQSSSSTDVATNRKSPVVSLAFRVAGQNNSAEQVAQNISATLSNVITANVSITASVFNNSFANVRIDISDRSDNSNITAWEYNVAENYNLISSSVVSLFALTLPPRVLTSQEPHCPPPMFQCSVTRACISSAKLCDGIPDCEVVLPGATTSEDENPVLCGDSKNTFACNSGDQFISNLFWCDGVQDCADNSDETSEDCLFQNEVRIATNASSALNPWNRAEYLGFVFSEPVSVQCVTIDQPLHSLSSLMKVYACDESAVFQATQGVVLRYPDLNCVEVQATAIRSSNDAISLTYPPINSAVVNPSDLVYNSLESLPIQCSWTTNSSSDDPCPVLTGQALAFCSNNNGNDPICQFPINASHAKMTVNTKPSCNYDSPISPAVGASIVERYTAADSSVNSSILEDFTYTCFCDQQAQYNSKTDLFFIYPPFSSSVQITCSTYYTKLLRDQLLGIVAILVVAGLNFLLQLVMYWLSDFERKYSLTAKAGSEMWKLFLAQFINTAVLVLIVNAKFYGSRLSFAGLGAGEYPDTTEEWFLNIGSGLSITMLILIGSLIIPNFLFEFIYRWFTRRWARNKLTQEAMNRQLEPSEFMLSLRLAQSTNMIVVTVLYCSAIPVMVWISATYCFFAYWADKIFLLRYSRIPPQYSDHTVKICLRLMPIAVICNCLFMIWTMSNQEVFPSDFFSEPFHQYWASFFNEISSNAILRYISGSSQLENSASSYRTYIFSRLLDSLRKAPIGGYIVLAILVLYFIVLILIFFFSLIIGPLLQFCKFGFARKSRSKIMRTLSRFASSHFLYDSEKDKPPFEEVKKLLDEKNLITSYRMKAQPKYADAYDAINKARQKAAIKSARARNARMAMAAQSSQSSQQGQPAAPLYPSINDPASPLAGEVLHPPTHS